MELHNSKFTKTHTKVYCEDEWKFNAPHHFTIKNSETDEVLCTINMQEGPINEVGINGISNEDLLLIVLTRLESFQNSEFRCGENAEAIKSILDAYDSLRLRTYKREKRDVEGTSIV